LRVLLTVLDQAKQLSIRTLLAHMCLTQADRRLRI
jgi:hypothetical protein